MLVSSYAFQTLAARNYVQTSLVGSIWIKLILQMKN